MDTAELEELHAQLLLGSHSQSTWLNLLFLGIVFTLNICHCRGSSISYSAQVGLALP